MSYQESLSYLYGLQQFGIKLGLANIQGIVESIGDPQDSYPIVHLAGTNGKGSTAAFLSTILIKAGYRTGLYTSPHLHSFCERIQIDGVHITESEVVVITDRIRKSIGDIPATFFEFTTAMALAYFNDQQVDVAILETGMGGRLDATNVVTPILTVITPIACDHQQYLGDGLAAIAAEKAGIIKEGIPVVSASQAREAQVVIRTISDERSARLLEQNIDFSIAESAVGFNYRGLYRKIDHLAPALIGRHQFDNAALALASAELLVEKGFIIDSETMKNGIETARWPGRLEWIRFINDGDGESRIPVLLDGAHNQQGAMVLADYIQTNIEEKPIWIAGFKNDKAVDEIVAAMQSTVSTIIAVEPPIDDALPNETLRELLAERENVICAESVEEALAVAKSLALRVKTAQSIVVAGSLFLVAEARRILLAPDEVSSV